MAAFAVQEALISVDDNVPDITYGCLSTVPHHGIRRFVNAMTLISIEAYTLFLQLNQAMLGSRTYGCSVAISKQVMFYLADHVDRPFNSEALGRHLNLNYSYISTVFRRETGQSVIERILNCASTKQSNSCAKAT